MIKAKKKTNPRPQAGVINISTFFHILFHIVINTNIPKNYYYWKLFCIFAAK